jgi:hypothetical protein
MVVETHTHVVTPETTQVVTPMLRKMVSSGVLEAAETLLDDQMLAFPRLQLVNDLCSPGAFGNERSVAASGGGCRRCHAPVWDRRVRVVRLHDVSDIDNWSAGRPEGVGQSHYLGYRSLQEGHVDVGFRIFAGPSRDGAVVVDKIVLHIDDDQGGAVDLGANLCCRHFISSSFALPNQRQRVPMGPARSGPLL